MERPKMRIERPSIDTILDEDGEPRKHPDSSWVDAWSPVVDREDLTDDK